MIQIKAFMNGAVDPITQQPLQFELGKRGIKDLQYHPAEKDDPNHYVDVHMNDGAVIRHFSIVAVVGNQSNWNKGSLIKS